MRKRGQYFTLDAFTALLVLSIGIFLIFAVNSYDTGSRGSKDLVEDSSILLAQTQIKTLNNPFVKDQILAGNITNTDNTIMQQAFEFKRYFDSNSSGHYNPSTSNLSARFLEAMTTELLPRQFGFEILIDGDRIYGKGTDPSASEVLISNKQILFGILNKSGEFWGPVSGEIRIWE